MQVLIVRNNFNSSAMDASLLLATYLATQGIEHVLLDSCDLGLGVCDKPKEVVKAHDFDLTVVLGGDGTILRTAQLIGTSEIPLLGINFGRLGFLANSAEEGVVSIVAAALAGDVVKERRTNLRIDVVCEGDEGEPLFDDEPTFSPEGERRSFFALNEFALNRGSLGRILDFELSIAGSSIAEMRGDGLVVATATGSTAYALSAGGPLVAPSFNGLIVVPLAPHSLHSRAIVTGPHDIVEVEMTSDAPEKEPMLFIDGEKLEFKRRVTKVLARRGSHSTVLLRYKRSDFYEHASEVFF